jgi:hypothetical protein
MADPTVQAYYHNVRFGNEGNPLAVRVPRAFCQSHTPNLAYNPPKNVYLPDGKTVVTANVANFHKFFDGKIVGEQIFEIAVAQLKFDRSPLKDPVFDLELTTTQYEFLVVRLCEDKIPRQFHDLIDDDMYRKTKDFVDKLPFGELGDPDKASTYYNTIWQEVLLNLTVRVLTTPGRSLDDFTRYNLVDQLCPPTEDRSKFRKYLPAGTTSYEALQFLYHCIGINPEYFVKSLWRHRGAI